MKHFQKILLYLIILFTSHILAQTDLFSQDDSLTKMYATISDSNEVNKAIEARIFLVQKDTSKCDSNINHKTQPKKIKKDIKGFFFSSFSLGGSKGEYYDMKSNFASLRITAGYADESFPIPLGLSVMYSEDIVETPTTHQTDVGLSVFLPWGEHYPFFALELGGGITFGNVRIARDTIIDQKIGKIESTEKLKGWYFSVSGELLFVGIGDDFALGVMCSYTVHFAKPFY